MPKRSRTNIELNMIRVMMGILSASERSSRGSPSGVVGTPIADEDVKRMRHRRIKMPNETG
jgi:hypothetical protein